MANYRVWMLFVTYGCCFGIELFVHNVAASYYVDQFKLDLQSAGMAAGSFGLLALFARALGGILSDRLARTRGLDARTLLLFALMVGEGIGLLWFSSTETVATAVAAMITFGLFTHMACGATYALVPFIDRKALGGVAGIIGAGRQCRGGGGWLFAEGRGRACSVLRDPRWGGARRLALRTRGSLQRGAQGARTGALREGGRGTHRVQR